MALIPAFASLHSGGEGTLAMALLAGPAMAGSIVCGIGKKDAYYEGKCLPAVVGAYVGSLSALPLAYLGCMADDNSKGERDFRCVTGAISGFLVGYVLGTTIGANVGWHGWTKVRSSNVAF